MMAGIVYRKLPKYKYQLLEAYEVEVAIDPPADIDTPFVRLSRNGVIWMREGYAWDGPSGPTVDTRTFMRGSLVHDALYQLIRLSKLDARQHRKPADEVLRQLCIADGMWWFRAWYVHLFVRLFGGFAVRPRPRRQSEARDAP